MPNYTYQCKPCEKEFTAQRTMKEASETMPCPDCHAPAERTLWVGGMRVVGGTPQHHRRMIG